MEYNTTRNYLIMREYGRHIQKMIEYLLSLEDKEIRQRNAYAVIELMGFLNPHLKNVEDFRHKLWDHLFLVSDFKLDVESPYPIPTRETLRARPKPLTYPKRYPKFSHLGKNLELVINKALKEENPEKRQGFANAVAYYMKLAYSNWHKEAVHDDAIQSELTQLTDGQLEFTNTPYVRSHRPNEGRDNNRGGSGYSDFRNKRNNNNNNQKFQPRGSGNNGGGGGGQRNDRNDRNDRSNNGGAKFKKRFK
ncbi:MAG: DUF4290 domain-containing protein [Pedobacter sp.]|nr:MAG: DUF4290 domain-containing protein [Pedobacter sp.]